MSDDVDIIEPATAVSTAAKQSWGVPWQKGQSGNPAGRPKGSRNRHGENFLSAFAADFERHGAAIIEQVRIEQPAIYLKIASDLLPKETASQLDPGAEFRLCDTAEDVLRRLAEEDLEANIEHARWMLDGLL